MLQAVSGGGSGKGGGVFAPTGGSPVGVSDQLLGTPGTSGFPAPQTGAAKEARNNRGSNEKVPYARLVPVQSSLEKDGAGGMIMTLTALPASHGIQAEAGAHVVKNEYADLKSGELAWVRGNYVRDGKSVRPPGILDFGIGPDRFQRLASTSWVERYFYRVFGGDKINLAQLKITDERWKPGEPLAAGEIAEFAPYLSDSYATNVADVPHLLALEANAAGALMPSEDEQLVPAKAPAFFEVETDPATGLVTKSGAERVQGGQFRCGINTTTTSPFLHGFFMDVSYVKVGRVGTPSSPVETRVYTVADEPPQAFYEFARNYGDNMAFLALYSHMRARGFFSWSPDGLTLSKLASPSGDQMASEELDTRSGQLFNVAVAGNSIATTWTGDPTMPAMPGDSVYILLVADVETLTKAGSGSAKGLNKEVKAARAELADAYKAPDATRNQQIRAAREKLAAKEAALYKPSTQVESLATLKGHADDVEAYVDFVKTGVQLGPEVEAKRKQAATGSIDHSNVETAKKAYADIAALSQEVRANKRQVLECSMTNFRWRRCTSSYLANNAAINLQSKHSRCGLPLGFRGADTVSGQYIVGAWRIGTVLDNAASRAGAPSMGVRTAPSSYAISVNVNVQWVSGDYLFRKYDGRNVGLVGRGEMPAPEADANQYTPEEYAPSPSPSP